MSYQLTGAQERRRNNETKANEFYQRVRQQEEELKSLQSKLAETERQHSDLQSQKSDMDARMRALAATIETTNRSLNDLKAQITGKKQSIERDQTEMVKFQNVVVRFDGEIGVLMMNRQPR